MVDTGDRKYLLNAEILGQMVIDGGGAYTSLKGGTAGLTDTALSAGINNTNILSAINSAYAKADGNEPQGPQYALQINSPDGTFSGSALYLAQQTAGSLDVTQTGLYTVSGLASLDGGIDVNSGEFTVDTSGNIVGVAGTLSGLASLDGGIDVADKFTVAAGGDIAVDTDKFTVSAAGAVDVASTLDVTGESTLASATVTDLTSGRVVLAGTAGAIEDSANLTFDGSDLKALSGDISASADLYAGGALEVLTTAGITGAATLGSTLSVTGIATFTASPVLNGGAITNGNIAAANTIFSNSTGKTTIGFGDIDLSATTAMTTVKGTLNVAEAVTLDSTLDVDAAISGSSTVMAAGGYQLVGTNAAGARRVFSVNVEGGLLVVDDESAP